MDIKVDLMLLTSRTRKLDERHPVVIRLTEGRDRKYKRTPIYCHVDEWDKKRSYPKDASIDEERALDKSLQEVKDRISKLKGDGETVSLDTVFESAKKKQQPKVLEYFERIITLLKNGDSKNEPSPGNAFAYSSAHKSLKTFLFAKQSGEPLTDKNKRISKEYIKRTKDIKFKLLNKDLLDEYNHWLTKRGANPRTKAAYFRTIKALYFRAIYDKDVQLNKDWLPFGRKEDKERFYLGQFSMTTKKRAITSSEVKSIMALDLLSKPRLENAREYFIFGLFGRGIDWVDICRLTWSNYNIKTGRIEYVRHKTRSKSDEAIDFEVDEVLQAIINKRKPKDTIPKAQDFIFSEILNREEHKTEDEMHTRWRSVITQVNRDLKVIAEMAKINAPLSTKWTRHTFASILYKESGASLSMVSELLRHGDEKTTKIYVKNLETDTKDEAVKKMRKLIG